MHSPHALGGPAWLACLVFAVPLCGASGCLVPRPTSPSSNGPAVRLQILDAKGQPHVYAPDSTLGGHDCVFVHEDPARVQLLLSDGTGLRSATVRVFAGEPAADVVLNDLGVVPEGDDTRVRPIVNGLQLQFAEREGLALNGAAWDLAVVGLPASIHVEAVDRQGNRTEFADVIGLVRVGTPDRSCAGA